MLPNLNQPLPAHRLKLVAGATLVLALAACGGGGGNPGSTGGTTAGNTPPTTTPNPPAPVPVEPKMTVDIVSGANAEVKTLSGGQGGIVRAKFVDSKGAAIEGAKVKFISDEPLVVFDPVSASATTDKDGIATINIRPASTTSAGSVKITATGDAITGIDSGKSATAAKIVTVGAAPLVVDEVAFTPALSAPVSAFSTASMTIKLSSGGVAATDMQGLVIDSNCARQGLAAIDRGTLNNGVLTATYTNKGCLAGTDVVTVSANNTSKTANVAVSGANIGTIQFAGTDLQGSSIVLKGAGGLDRKESALLTYRVLDQNNRGLAGVDVNFSATTVTGGLVVQPVKGTTDADGRVTTTVSSGTIPTPVRVVAKATRNGVEVVGLSDTLIISTGLPIQKSMSLSVDSYNIEGWRRDGTEANVTVRLADQYGNRISDGTAVNLITEGGAIANSAQGGCVTENGACTVKLVSQNFRPTNGRVTILAYVQGLENFVDANGDGQYSCTRFTDPNGLPVAKYRPLIDICEDGFGEAFTDQGDPFLDAGILTSTLGTTLTGTLDGVLHPTNGDLPIPYNRVSYSATGNNKWGINYIWSTAEVTFSDNDPILVRMFCNADNVCRDWQTGDGDVNRIVGLHGAGCSTQRVTFRLRDVNNNPLPHLTRLSTVDADKVAPLSVSPDVVGSTNRVGGTIHFVNVRPDSACAAGSFGLRITSPRDASSNTFSFSSAPLPTP